MSSVFSTKVKNIGVVADGSVTKIIFSLNDGTVTSSGASCGCTAPKFNHDTKELEVTYTASKPKGVDKVNINKMLWAEVRKSDGTSVRETLTIEGVVA
jgi:hypothetical protein